MDGKGVPMDILGFFLNPPKDPEIKKEQHKRLSRSKQRQVQQNCIHFIEFEKWIHSGPKQGQTYHYKEICRLCGYRRTIPRSKRVYEAVKDLPWHKKKKKGT